VGSASAWASAWPLPLLWALALLWVLEWAWALESASVSAWE
jgi:hypothetical protein